MVSNGSGRGVRYRHGLSREPILPRQGFNLPDSASRPLRVQDDTQEFGR